MLKITVLYSLRHRTTHLSLSPALPHYPHFLCPAVRAPLSRLTPPPPLFRGTNDGAGNITLSMVAVLNDVMAACPGTPIVVLRPFNGDAQAANLQAACAASAAPALCHYVSTEGFYDTQYGGALHPTGPNDVARVAPAIANAVRPILAAALAARHALSAEEEALVVAPGSAAALQLTSEERELVLAHRARRRQ